MTRTLAGLCRILAVSFRLGPWAGISAFCETLGRITRALIPWMLGMTAAGAIAKDAVATTIALAALAATYGASNLLTTIGTHTRLILMERVGQRYDAEIALLSGQCPTLEHLETADFLDKTQNLREAQGILGRAYNAVINVIHNAATPITLVIVAIHADWRMAFAVAALIPTVFATQDSVVHQSKAEKSGAEAGRLSAELFDLVLDPRAGSEVRVYRAREWLRSRLRTAVEAWRRPHTRASRRSSLMLSAASGFYLAVCGAVLVALVTDALAGRVSIAAVVTAASSISELGAAASSVHFVVMGTGQLIRIVQRYHWLLDYTADIQARHKGSQEAPERLSHGIELTGACFSYPGSEKIALDGVDLHLPAGSVIAVVGENGAGKSTLVKILTGMYDLSAGQVLIDGTPLSNISLPSWRERCSGAFQDHYRFETTAGEAVGLGDLPHLDDEDRIRSALSRAAASEIVERLPHGLHTQLGTQWPDGVDLSGGQWQRLAIARGLMRTLPLLLVLDEPTSAIDAATESALFDSYVSAAQQVSSHDGAITVIVTHRFATVKDADLIVVLDRGRIVEQGSHTDLMAASGTYAEMYLMQASGYQ